MVSDRGRLRAVSGVDSVAGWFYMPWLRGKEGVVHGPWPVALSGVPATVFEDSRKPLRLWFHVMWLMMGQKTGLSARNLCDTYGFGSYQTAWGWLQKLRSVMIRTGREPLAGRVEVDETYVGGRKEGARGRGAEGKTAVLVAVEGDPKKKLGRVRFRCVEAIDRASVELDHRVDVFRGAAAGGAAREGASDYFESRAGSGD